MDTVHTRIIEGFQEIFPEVRTMNFNADSILGDLPEWDSMAAVNLQTYLNQQFAIDVPLELLADETTLEELAEFIKNPVSSESV